MVKGKGASVYGEEVRCQKESDKKFQKILQEFPFSYFLHDKVDKLCGFLCVKFDNQKIIL